MQSRVPKVVEQYRQERQALLKQGVDKLKQLRGGARGQYPNLIKLLVKSTHNPLVRKAIGAALLKSR